MLSPCLFHHADRDFADADMSCIGTQGVDLQGDWAEPAAGWLDLLQFLRELLRTGCRLSAGLTTLSRRTLRQTR